MRYAPGHKARTREKILEAAGRVFRRRGFEGAGVDEVMREAGLTPGGFYAHFRSKEELLGEALAQSASRMEEASRARLDGLSGGDWLNAFVEWYLSRAHRGNLEAGCPLAALVSEVARSSESVKDRFESILTVLSANLSARVGDGLAEDRSLAILALCIGGLGMARSVRDEALADRILAACGNLAQEACRNQIQTRRG